MGQYSKLIVAAVTVALIHLNHYLGTGVDEGEITSGVQIAVDALLSVVGLFVTYQVRNKPLA